MTNVVCKFKLSGITRRESGTQDGKPLILSTLEFFPVSPKSVQNAKGGWENDPTDENTVFWKYSPSGKFELGTVNEDAVQSLDLGREYYLIITDRRPAGLGNV